MRETCLEQRDLLATAMQNYELTSGLHAKLDTVHDSLYGISPTDCSPPSCPPPCGDTGVLAICELNALSLEGLSKKVDVIIASLGRINLPSSCGSMQSPHMRSLHDECFKPGYDEDATKSRMSGCSQIQQPDPCDKQGAPPRRRR